MAPFRPSNLNKRLYPGNGSVVGPTRDITLGITTTTCCACCSNVCGPSIEVFTLGCRTTTTTCVFCHCCRCCECTVCDRTVPSGMWKASEQYEAKERDAWGPDTSSNGPETLYEVCVGDCTGGGNDCKGFYVCQGPSTTRWFVAPSCNEICRNWNNRAQAVTVTNSNMGSCGWFVPECNELKCAGFSCRTYWDSYASSHFYWSNTEYNACGAFAVSVETGSVFSIPHHHFGNYKGTYRCIRTMRCTPT